MSRNITIIIPGPTVSIKEMKKRLKKDEILILRSFIAKVDSIKILGETIVKEELIGPALKRNAIKCNCCGDTIESLYHLHSSRCSCGKCKVDGGLEILTRICSATYTELAEYY